MKALRIGTWNLDHARGAKHDQARLEILAEALAKSPAFAKYVKDRALATRPLLVIVPRHPQRFDEVAALMRASGLTISRRSEWAGMPRPADLDADAWLGDSMREMPLYYGLGQVALLGGSFAPLGGQNLIEAAACGCPLLMGPHTFNFADAAEGALAAGAARRVADIDEGVRLAADLAGDPGREADSTRALAWAALHRGAAERMAAAIVALLPPP